MMRCTEPNRGWSKHQNQRALRELGELQSFHVRNPGSAETRSSMAGDRHGVRHKLPPHFMAAFDAVTRALEYGLIGAPPSLATESAETLWKRLGQKLGGDPGARVFQDLVGVERSKAAAVPEALLQEGLSEEQVGWAARHMRFAVASVDALPSGAFEEVLRDTGINIDDFVVQGEVERHAAAVWLYASNPEYLRRAVFIGRYNRQGRISLEVEPAEVGAGGWKRKVEKAFEIGARLDESPSSGIWHCCFWAGDALYLVAREAGVLHLGEDAESKAATASRGRRFAVFRCAGSEVRVSALRPARWRTRLEGFFKSTFGSSVELSLRDPAVDGTALREFVKVLLDGQDKPEDERDSIVLRGIRWLPVGVSEPRSMEIPNAGVLPLGPYLANLGLRGPLDNYASAAERISFRFRERIVEVVVVDEGDERLRLAFAGLHPPDVIKLALETRLRARGLELGHYAGQGGLGRERFDKASAASRLLRHRSTAVAPVDGERALLQGWSTDTPRLGAVRTCMAWRCSESGDASLADVEHGVEGCTGLVEVKGSLEWSKDEDVHRDADDGKVACTLGHRREAADYRDRAMQHVWEFALDREVAQARVEGELRASALDGLCPISPSRWQAVHGRTGVDIALALRVEELADFPSSVPGRTRLLVWAGHPVEDERLKGEWGRRCLLLGDFYPKLKSARLLQALGRTARSPRGAGAKPAPTSIGTFVIELQPPHRVNGVKPFVGGSEIVRAFGALLELAAELASDGSAPGITFDHVAKRAGRSKQAQRDAFSDAFHRMLDHVRGWTVALPGKAVLPVVLSDGHAYRLNHESVELRRGSEVVWPK